MNNSDAGKNLIWLIVIVLSVVGIVLYADYHDAYSFQELFTEATADKLLGILFSIGSFYITILFVIALNKWWYKRK